MTADQFHWRDLSSSFRTRRVELHPHNNPPIPLNSFFFPPRPPPQSRSAHLSLPFILRFSKEGQRSCFLHSFPQGLQSVLVEGAGSSSVHPSIMTCFSFFCHRRAETHSSLVSEVDEELQGLHNVKLFSYKALEIASEDFSPANKIGEGGFGSVYKGRLKDGRLVAIKVLSAESRQGVKEFLTEIKVIADVEHENLVKLYGCCVEGNHRILVYNYLENNSLAQTLIDGRRSGIQFSWKTRKRICIGVAQGFAFLHEEVQPYIVHRDIKASNILLDKDLTPKISDFGLAKLIPSNMTHVSTRVAGTIGYLAPEYAIRGQLTRKADIYSFGVLLVEIVCGRCNTNTKLPVGEQYLLERTWELYERRELVALVDSSLNGDFDAEEACRFLKIGLLCTQDTPRSRPSMSTVVKMLKGERRVDDSKITKPGLITDFMDLKVRGGNQPSAERKSACNSYNSGSENPDASPMSSANSSGANTTFTVNSSAGNTIFTAPFVPAFEAVN